MINRCHVIQSVVTAQQSRDPDLFITNLERRADRENILMKDIELGYETSSNRNKNIGVMAIGTLDRDLKEITSTKGKNFAYLINRYTYRRGQVSEGSTKRGKSKLSVTETHLNIS